MDDNRILWYKEFKKYALNENYPAGSSSNSNAPWNQKDGDIRGRNEEIPKSGIYLKVESEGDEYIIMSDNKDLYAIFVDDIDNMNDLDSYRESWEPTEGEVEYTDNLNAEGIENWAWNEVSKEEIGEGLDDWESTNYIITKLDDALAQELYNYFAKVISDKYRSKSKHSNRALNRESKLAYVDMMDDIKEKFPNVSSEWED